MQNKNSMKKIYVVPKSDLIEIRCEGIIAGSGVDEHCCRKSGAALILLSLMVVLAVMVTVHYVHIKLLKLSNI